MSQSSALVIDTPAGIAAYRLLAIRSALRLELVGLKHSRGISAAKLAKAELVAAGKKAPSNKQALSDAYTAHLREIGVLLGADITLPRVVSPAV